MKKHRLRTLPRKTALASAVALAFSLAIVPEVHAQTWNAGTGDWSVAGNWNPAIVPGTGAIVIVSNGGTAQLSGFVTTPLLNSLSVGLGTEGTGVGNVQSSGVGILTSGSFSVGTSFGATTTFAADGELRITGADAQGNSARVGSIASTTASGTANGVMEVGGSLLLSGGGGMQVGEIFNAASGSVANGTLTIGGDAGTASLLIAGSVFPVDVFTQTGSRASGTIDIGGNLALTPGGFARIGAASGPQIGALFNEATGSVTIDGVLSFAGPASMVIGVADAGVANGALSVGSLNMGANHLTGLAIGTTSQGGNATGSLVAGSGDLRMAGSLGIGQATGINGGNANGTLILGGALDCVTGCGPLSVGTGAGSGLMTVAGNASTNGISGFTGYTVGALNGNGLAAGSSAQGTLISTGAGPSGSTNFISVGTVFNMAGGAGTANGTMNVGGPLLLNGGGLHVGEIFGSASGSVANGALGIGGNAGMVNILVAGSVFPADVFTQTGSQASGTIGITNGGSLTLAAGGFANIGASFGPRIGPLFNKATGSVTIEGALNFAGNANLSIGITEAGEANGALRVGSLNMGGAHLTGLAIGTSSQGGVATGSLIAGSGDLRMAGSLGIGQANGVNGGSANGTLTLGGALTCVTGCGSLSIGTASGSGAVTASGIASVTAASGFSSYSVGMLNGSALAGGSSAQGTLTVSAGGLVAGNGGASTGFLGIGSAFGAGFGSQAGSVANGTVKVSGGNISGYQFVSIGEALSSGASATGTLELTSGTLSAPQFLAAGQSFDGGPGGTADGTLRLSNASVVMTPGGIAAFGVAGGGGQATGRLIAEDSILLLSALSVGNSFSGARADGFIDLTRSSLHALDLLAGGGNGASATMRLLESTLDVDNALSLANGLLSLDDSFAHVGGTLTLADAATLHIDIDGLLRGSEYGAIDAALAMLDGVLSLSFADLFPVGDLMTFDLIRSASASGITGDFDSILFDGLPAGYFLTAGIVLDGVETYRVQLARQSVPEPGTLLLFLAAVLGFFGVRRRSRLH